MRVSTSGGNHSAPGARSVRRRDERDRMRHDERRHHRGQRSEAAERDHQAEEEQQVVRAVEEVTNAERHEQPHRLDAARIELHEPRIAVELEGANRAAGRQETQHRQRAEPQAREARLNRERRLRRLNGVLEEHVEQPLAPEELALRRQPRPRQMRDGLVVGRKRLVGLQRGAHRDHARRRQLPAVLVQVQVVRHPERRRVAQRGVSARQVEQIGVGGPGRPGIVHVAHRLERRADGQPQTLAVGLEQRLDGHVVRDVVGGRRGDPEHGKQPGQQGPQNRRGRPMADGRRSRDGVSHGQVFLTPVGSILSRP